MDAKRRSGGKIHDEDWTNIMLKLELDLRSQFSFISYLACVRSCIYPRLGGELAEVPTIGEILKLCESKEETKPFSVPLSFYLGAYQYVVTDKKKLTLSKRRQLQYDYLRDDQYRYCRDLPSGISYDTHLLGLAGFKIYSLLVGNQSISATWHGQLRLKPDAVGQTLNIMLFRYKPMVPQSMYNLPHHKCEAVSNFLFRDLAKFEASRLLRIAIPVDHIGGIHLLPYPSESSSNSPEDEQKALKRPGILGIDIIHPVCFYTRRINCTHTELNRWRERGDFSKNSLGSTYTRYMFCGSMEDLCQVVGVLMRLRPRLVNKSMQGIPDVTQISVTQFGSDHTSPAEGESSEHESNEISPEMVAMLTEEGIIDPSLGQHDDPLDGYDMCFHDFIDRVGDVQTAEEGLNRDILEFTPPCKVKEYMIDHRGLGGRYYSFCKGKVVGDDTYHCRECKTCSGLEHWHSHSHLKNAVAPCEPTDKKFFYPIPLSGKLMATHSERPHINESGNASGVDDKDEPQWPSPKAIEDIYEDGDWQDLRN